jgi:hypothetical protein
MSDIACDRLAMDLLAAEASSTRAAFCWVIWSSCATARFTCSIPESCSWLPAASSAMMSLTFLTEETMRSSVWPD